jgi:hypothetical protein
MIMIVIMKAFGAYSSFWLHDHGTVGLVAAIGSVAAAACMMRAGVLHLEAQAHDHEAKKSYEPNFPS